MKNDSMKNSAQLLAAFGFALTTLPAFGQQAQSVIPGGTNGPTVVSPGKGLTENLSVTNGSRTTLSVGNSTAFGSSSNISAGAGVVAVSRSVLIPSSVGIVSTIGSNPSKLGVTNISISNLSAKGSGTITPGSNSGAGSDSKVTSDCAAGYCSNYASGNALIDGMGAEVKMTIGNDANSQASFFTTVHQQVDGAACAPTATVACKYVLTDNLMTGNAGASANLSTNTNIDIQANSFTQTFAQSF